MRDVPAARARISGGPPLPSMCIWSTRIRDALTATCLPIMRLYETFSELSAEAPQRSNCW